MFIYEQSQGRKMVHLDRTTQSWDMDTERNFRLRPEFSRSFRGFALRRSLLGAARGRHSGPDLLVGRALTAMALYARARDRGR